MRCKDIGCHTLRVAVLNRKDASLNPIVQPPDMNSVHPLDVPQLWEAAGPDVNGRSLIVFEKLYFYFPF